MFASVLLAPAVLVNDGLRVADQRCESYDLGGRGLSTVLELGNLGTAPLRADAGKPLPAAVPDKLLLGAVVDGLLLQQREPVLLALGVVPGAGELVTLRPGGALRLRLPVLAPHPGIYLSCGLWSETRFSAGPLLHDVLRCLNLGLPVLDIPRVPPARGACHRLHPERGTAVRRIRRGRSRHRDRCAVGSRHGRGRRHQRNRDLAYRVKRSNGPDLRRLRRDLRGRDGARRVRRRAPGQIGRGTRKLSSSASSWSASPSRYCPLWSASTG